MPALLEPSHVSGRSQQGANHDQCWTRRFRILCWTDWTDWTDTNPSTNLPHPTTEGFYKKDEKKRWQSAGTLPPSTTLAGKLASV